MLGDPHFPAEPHDLGGFVGFHMRPEPFRIADHLDGQGEIAANNIGIEDQTGTEDLGGVFDRVHGIHENLIAVLLAGPFLARFNGEDHPRPPIESQV